LEILDRYLEIQAIRFGSRLTIEKTIDPESLSVFVPPMILQPLVENGSSTGSARDRRRRRRPRFAPLAGEDRGRAVTRTGIRTVLVDDEPLAREGLRLRLARASDLEIVGEAGDGPTGVRCIVETQPDLVFLDVQMPGMDGFQLVHEIAPVHLPLIVFVTAFDEFAVRAFKVHAVDYAAGCCRGIGQRSERRRTKVACAP